MTRNEAIERLSQPGVCFYAEQIAAICDIIDLLWFRLNRPDETPIEGTNEAGETLSKLVHIAEAEARKRGTLGMEVR